MPFPICADLRAAANSLISHPMDPNAFDSAQDLWVFAYGSLMWRPEFRFIERVEARLVGAHRALCVYSFVHRGTPERPGLVLGLDRGGTCRGIAYRVAAAERARDVQRNVVEQDHPGIKRRVNGSQGFRSFDGLGGRFKATRFCT